MVKELSRYEDPDDPVRPQAPPRDRKALWAPPGPRPISAPEVLVVGLGRRLRADEDDGPRARLGAGAVEALQRRYQIRTFFDADVQGYVATCRASLDKSGRAGVQKIHLMQPLVEHDTDVAHALEKMMAKPRLDKEQATEHMPAPSHIDFMQAPIFGSFIGDSKFLPAASLALGDLSCLRPLVAVAATTSAWAAARRARARSQRSLCWATLATDKQGTTFLVGPEAATRLPSNVSLGRLLTWARKQAFMKVHPVLSASNAKLSVSVAVEAGTPLLGVLEEGFLTYEDSEDSWQQLYDAAKKQHPEWWALHLAIPLLRHASGDASDEASSPVWQAYQQSALDANSKRGVPELPASALLWNVEQASELQDVEVKAALKSRLEALQSFHRDHVLPALRDSAPSTLELGCAVAVAASRGVEVQPGLKALVPVLDLIGPAEAAAAVGEETPEPNCHLTVEPAGGPGGRAIAVVTAARDLRAGDFLSRDVDACADSLLLDWGLASSRRRDDVTIHVGIKKDVAQSWQVSALRELLELRPGEDGGWVASAKVRRSSSLRDALDQNLWVAARILGGGSKTEALGAEWDLRSREEILRAGLDGVSATHRRRAFWVLKKAVQGALDNFETSPEDDEEAIHLAGDERQRVAAAYRLGKKRILQDVFALLDKADTKIVQRRERAKQANASPPKAKDSAEIPSDHRPQSKGPAMRVHRAPSFFGRAKCFAEPEIQMCMKFNDWLHHAGKWSA
ncbi:unnamed protein product [Symbiodinium natans]|uniref:Rubisco LSMT substrate-binding domain-containing protein n=1 Tax=Symbiodinium natans TaxID=878477 RepID=A0A812RS64_9DINO|nr:unnamed protein product [Symbiodinium natans]